MRKINTRYNDEKKRFGFLNCLRAVRTVNLQAAIYIMTAAAAGARATVGFPTKGRPPTD